MGSRFIVQITKRNIFEFSPADKRRSIKCLRNCLCAGKTIRSMLPPGYDNRLCVDFAKSIFALPLDFRWMYNKLMKERVWSFLWSRFGILWIFVFVWRLMQYNGIKSIRVSQKKCVMISFILCIFHVEILSFSSFSYKTIFFFSEMIYFYRFRIRKLRIE